MSTDTGTPQRRSWTRRTIISAAATTGAALAGGLSACSSGKSNDTDDKLKSKIKNPPKNFNREGFPIVEKPIKLQFMTGRFASNADDYNQVANWKQYQKMTNVRVNWGLVPFDNRQEKRNLALSSGDYPEAFNTMGITTLDAGKYGRQGNFLALNSLIDECMPNLKKLMKKNDDIRAGMTFPDGNIYGLFAIKDPDFMSYRLESKIWARSDWLDKFDMEVPETTQDYYHYLKAVKRQQPNGKTDAIGYCSEFHGDMLRRNLMGSFGVGNRGLSGTYVDVDPDNPDSARFYRVSDGYKALLEYLHRLYSEGLIAKNIFSIDRAKFTSAATKGTYGSLGGQAPAHRYNAKNFVGLPALKGPRGDHDFNGVVPTLGALGFVITDKCSHPLAAARWMDYFYSDAGVQLFFMGVEGKSFKETADGVEYLDKIKNPGKGMTENQAKSPYVTYVGGGYAGLVKEKYYKGPPSSQQAIEAAELLQPNAQTNIWPSFTYTQKESEQLDSLASDIEKYVDESFAKFITGDLKLSAWDKYVDKLKNMNLSRYMEIQQAAYDRYRKS